MPYARTSTGYPVQMRSIVEEVASDLQPRRIPCGSEHKARSARSRYYQFLAAVKRDINDPPKWLNERQVADLKDFLMKFMSLELVVDGDGLIIQPRDASDFGKMIEQAVVVAPAVVEEQQGALSKPEDELLQRLLNVQAKRKGE